MGVLGACSTDCMCLDRWDNLRGQTKVGSTPGGMEKFGAGYLAEWQQSVERWGNNSDILHCSIV